MRNPNCECTVCHKPIYKRPNELARFKNVFCSVACRGVFDTKPSETKPCKKCGIDFQTKKTEQIFCYHDCFEEYRREHPDEYPGHNKGGPKGQIAWNRGQKASDEVRAKISQGMIDSENIKGGWDNPSEEVIAARKARLSAAIQRRYDDGWMPKAGRCKKIPYHSPIAGEVLVDGTWELTVAEHLDSLGVKWRRNKSRFSYYFDDKDRYYTPDFFLEDLEIYVEVKGYETPKDVAKWEQFPHKLVVFRKKEIQDMRKSHFDLDGFLESAYN